MNALTDGFRPSGRRWRIAAALGRVGVLAAGLAWGAAAQASDWTSTTGGLFDDPANWNAGVPGPAATAVFNTNAPYQFVLFNTDQQTSRLIVRSEQFLIFYTNSAAPGPTYTLNQAGSATPALVVGEQNGDHGVLFVGNNVTLAAPYAAVGLAPGAVGSLRVDSNGVIQIGQTIFVGGDASGAQGTGELEAQDGGTIRMTNPAAQLRVYSTGVLSLFGGMVDVPVINADPGATLNWYGGRIRVSGPAGVTIDSGTFFGPTLSLYNYGTTPQVLDVPAVTTVGPGGALNVYGGTVTTPSLVNNGVVTVNTGTLTAGDITNNGTLTFYRGTVEITGPQGLNIGTGPLGTDLTLNPGMALHITGATTIDGSLLMNGGELVTGDLVHHGSNNFFWYSGSITLTAADAWIGPSQLFGDTLSLAPGMTLGSPNNFTRVTAGGTLSLDGGTLTAAAVLVDPAGSFTFNSGTLNLTNSNLVVSPSGLLGPTVNLPAGSTVIVGPTFTTSIDSAGQVNLTGGMLSTGNLTIANPATWNWTSGVLEITGAAGLDIGSGPLDPNLTLQNGQTLRVTNTLTIDGSLTLNNGGAVSAGVLVANGPLYWNSGAVSITGPDGLNIGSGPLGSDVTLENGRSLTVTNLLTIDGSLTINTGGALSAGDIVTNNTLTWNGGTIAITGPNGVNIGSGPLGSDLVLDNGQTLQVTNTTTVDGTLTINNTAALVTGSLVVHGANNFFWNGGSITLTATDAYIGPGQIFGATLSLPPGMALATGPNNTTRITAGGALSVDGGALTTGGLIIDPAGTFAFNSGLLSLTNSDLLIGTTGPLGAQVDLPAGKTLIVGPEFSTNLDSTGGVNLHGGMLSTGMLSIADLTQWSWTSGILEITGPNGLEIGFGPLGNNVTVGAGQELRVTNTLTVDDTLNVGPGGAVTAGSLGFGGASAVNWTGGAIHITNDNVFIGSLQPLGGSVDLPPGKSLTVAPAHYTEVFTGAALTINGGTLSTGTLFVDGGATFAFNSGTLNLTNSYVFIGSGTFLGAAVDLPAGKNLSAAFGAIVQADGQLSVSGGSLSAQYIYVDPAAQFAFTGGSLTLTGQDVVIDPGQLLTPSPTPPANFTIGAGMTLALPNNAIWVGQHDTGNLTVTAGGRASSSFVDVGSFQPDAFNPNAGRGTLTITGAGSRFDLAGDTHVGDYSRGSLVLTGGAVMTNGGWAFLGTQATGNGDALVADPGTLWQIAGDLRIGNNGQGRLTLSSGAHITTGFWVYLGADNPAANGRADIVGGGTLLDVGGDLRVGNTGSGDLSVNTGAQITVGGWFYVAANSGSNGSFTLDGSGTRLDVAGDTRLGEAGNASLVTVRNGAVLTTGQWAYIGDQAGSFGYVNVNDPGTQWLIQGIFAGPLTVGASGAATLNVQNGGLVSTTGGFFAPGNLYVARYNTGSGNILVTGTNSMLNIAGAARIGGDDNAPGGVATVTIADGGQLNVAQDLRVWGANPGVHAGPSSLIVNGGTVTATQLDLVDGAVLQGYTTLTMPVNVLGSGAILDAENNAAGVLALNGAFTTAASALVNKIGPGTLALNGPQTHGAGAVLHAYGGVVALNTDAGGATPGPTGNLAVVLDGGTPATLVLGAPQRLASLTIGAGSLAQALPSTDASHPGRKPLLLGALTIANTPPVGNGHTTYLGNLDLTNNDLAVAFTPATHAAVLAAITDMVKSAANVPTNGSSTTPQWNGKGITSSSVQTYFSVNGPAARTLGVYDNNYNGNGTPYFTDGMLDGVSLGATPAEQANHVIVKYLYVGDLNGDGLVNGADYNVIDNAFVRQARGDSFVVNWQTGDLNGDGLLNGVDYNVIDNAQVKWVASGWNVTGPPVPPPPSPVPDALPGAGAGVLSAQTALDVTSGFAAAPAASAAPTVVPEPASLGLLLLGALVLLPARRRRPR